MRYFKVSRNVKRLYGKPIEGYVVYGHPDKIELKKGYTYYKEYELEKGPLEEFKAKLKEAVDKFLSMFKAKDGSPAGEVVYIGVDDTREKPRGYVQFKITKDIETIEGEEADLQLMGIDTKKMIPIVPIIMLLIGGVIGFFVGIAIAITLIVVGLLIGGDLGMGLAFLGITGLCLVMLPGKYKVISAGPLIVSGYYIAKYFGIV